MGWFCLFMTQSFTNNIIHLKLISQHGFPRARKVVKVKWKDSDIVSWYIDIYNQMKHLCRLILLQKTLLKLFKWPTRLSTVFCKQTWEWGLLCLFGYSGVMEILQTSIRHEFIWYVPCKVQGARDSAVKTTQVLLSWTHSPWRQRH